MPGPVARDWPRGPEVLEKTMNWLSSRPKAAAGLAAPAMHMAMPGSQCWSDGQRAGAASDEAGGGSAPDANG